MAQRARSKGKASVTAPSWRQRFWEALDERLGLSLLLGVWLIRPERAAHR